MKKSKIKYALIIALIGLTIGFTFSTVFDDTVEIVEDGETAQNAVERHQFQGETENTHISEEGLKLESETFVEEEKITEGLRVTGYEDNQLYIIRSGGEAVKYDAVQDSVEELGIDSTYGSVAGNFDYPGFNVIYADSDRDVYIRDLDTGDEEKLYEDVVEVLRTDSNRDGVPESAEIRLLNGSQMFEEPVDQESIETDWNQDGYGQSLNLKDGYLYSYDPHYGEERIVEADSFAYSDQTVYVSNSGEVSRLEFGNDFVDRGSYLSEPIVFDQNVELVQLIAEADLQDGDISVEVNSESGGSEEFSLGDGESSNEFSLDAENVTLSFDLESGDDSPVLESYNLVYLE